MTVDEMRECIQQLIEGSEQWKAIKMVVLGNGRIGKTSLVYSFNQIVQPNIQVLFTCNCLNSSTSRYLLFLLLLELPIISL